MVHDLYFEIFTNRESHYKWDKHIEYARRCNDVTDKYRHDWVSSLLFARQELGESFLRICGKNHPLLPLLQSKGDWQTDDLILMINVLINLKVNDVEYDKFKPKLISESRCKSEGKPFLEVLQTLSSAGFSGRLIKESKISKSPDMEVVNPDTEEKLFIEISRLGEGEDRELINDNYQAFSQQLEWQPDYLPYSLAQLRSLNDLELKKCLATVANCKEQAIKDETIVYYQDDMIRLAISHINKYDELIKWIEKNDYRKGLLGAPINFDDTYRLSNNKIDKETKQIPADCVGLIYIPVNAIYFMVFDPQIVIESFGLTMKKYPNVFGTVIYANLIDGAEALSELVNGNYFCIGKPNKAVSKYLLFAKNSSFALPLTDNTIDKLYSSFQHSKQPL